jgi:hypothetical protein
MRRMDSHSSTNITPRMRAVTTTIPEEVLTHPIHHRHRRSIHHHHHRTIPIIPRRVMGRLRMAVMRIAGDTTDCERLRRILC